MFDPFAGPGRFYKGNLHTHSTASDAVRGPEEVCLMYREAGYDFLALTDHFLPRYGFPISDTRAFRTNAFTTILGAEMHAPATGLGDAWHIVAAGLPLDFAPTGAGESGAELAARCAAAGAFVAIAHPAWYGLSVEDAESIGAAHAVEVYNYNCGVETDRADGWGLLDALSAKGRRLSAIATDDAHFKFDDFFGGWVMVKSESLEPEAIVAALKAGRNYSSQGPEIHAIEVGSEFVSVACSPAATVIGLGRGTASVTEFGVGMTEVSLPLKKFRAGGYVRVVVRDAAGKCAWSNPLWLDNVSV